MQSETELSPSASSSEDAHITRTYGNLIPWVGGLLCIFCYVVLFFSINHTDTLNRLDSTLVDIELNGRKMRLISEMMEIARSRTRITSQILVTSEPFQQDELRMQLDQLASRFAAVRTELVALPLDAVERRVLLEEQPRIVKEILPAQRHAVELALNGTPDQLAQARRLLYGTVIPGQTRMVDFLGLLIGRAQERTTQIAQHTLGASNQNKLKGIVTIIVILGTMLLLAGFVIARERRIQAALKKSHLGLEMAITERTAELSEAKDDLQRQIELVDRYVLTSRTDPDGIITYVSSAFCELTKYDASELIGRPHSVVKHPDTPPSEYAGLWKTIKRGGTWCGELRMLTKDGQLRWMDAHIEPEFDTQGQLKGYVAVRQDITDKKRIEKLSLTDPLTKLCNRLRLDGALGGEIERSRRYQHALSVILFDIDHFKEVNDTYGHQVGDEVLVAVAGIVQNAVRNTDIAGRWGGEEFLVICPGTGLQGACELAERIRYAIARFDFGLAGTRTCSFGVGLYHDGMNKDDLLAIADDALYRAKRGGRDQVAAA
ncbi:MAG: diguanylate cyclase [Chromatiaceae bacterium]|nr:diguanylate cyclase [Chromatiaceae bacterium]MCP5315749.1 diguanylate cyclase [Chromatiaceae bacterium]